MKCQCGPTLTDAHENTIKLPVSSFYLCNLHIAIDVATRAGSIDDTSNYIYNYAWLNNDHGPCQA